MSALVARWESPLDPAPTPDPSGDRRAAALCLREAARTGSTLRRESLWRRAAELIVPRQSTRNSRYRRRLRP